MTGGAFGDKVTLCQRTFAMTGSDFSSTPTRANRVNRRSACDERRGRSKVLALARGERGQERGVQLPCAAAVGSGRGRQQIGD